MTFCTYYCRITNLFYGTCREPLYTDNGLVDKFVWEPHTSPDNLKFLKIEKEGAYMVADPFVKRIKFWDSLGIPDIQAISEPLRALFVEQ